MGGETEHISDGHSSKGPDRGGAASHQRLLEAAARLIRQKGLAGASVRAIAKEAGMLPGSVTYRYPTKESLVVALMEEAVGRATAVVLRAIEGCEDPLERLRRAMGAHLRTLLTGEDGVYVLLFEWHRLSPQGREDLGRLRRRYEAVWDGIVHDAAGRNLLVPGIDLSLLRLFVFGAANWAAQWYRPGGRLDPDRVADALCELVGFGIVTPDQRAEDWPEQLRALTRGGE